MQNLPPAKKPFYKSWLFWAAIYGLFILGYSLAFIFIDPEKKVLLTSNELGDFLAGVFAPLAFLFLYLGYIQQGRELKQNTHALNLQAQELQNSVEQQRLLAEATIDDLNITKEQIQTQQRKELIEAQPFWHFSVNHAYKEKPNNSLGRGLNDSVYKSLIISAHLANSRAIAREVTITVMNFDRIVRHYKFPTFEKSPKLENVSLRLEYPDCFDSRGEMHLKYAIVYLDAMDNPQFQNFEIICKRNKDEETQYCRIERTEKSY